MNHRLQVILFKVKCHKIKKRCCNLFLNLAWLKVILLKIEYHKTVRSTGISSIKIAFFRVGNVASLLNLEKLSGGATDDYYGGYQVEGSVCTLSTKH